MGSSLKEAFLEPTVKLQTSRSSLQWLLITTTTHICENAALASVWPHRSRGADTERTPLPLEKPLVWSQWRGEALVLAAGVGFRQVFESGIPLPWGSRPSDRPGTRELWTCNRWAATAVELVQCEQNHFLKKCVNIQVYWFVWVLTATGSAEQEPVPSSEGVTCLCGYLQCAVAQWDMVLGDLCWQWARKSILRNFRFFWRLSGFWSASLDTGVFQSGMFNPRENVKSLSG